MIRIAFLLIVVLFAGCSNLPLIDIEGAKKLEKEVFSHSEITEIDDKQYVHTRDNINSDAILLINECLTSSYQSTLQENISLDTNAFTLSIAYNDDQTNKSFVLDLPSERAKIMYCTNEYVVVGFACGGPCSAQVFVFVEGKRPNEIYSYCQKVTSSEDLIVYVKNEEFEKLIIHNLSTGLEEMIDISDCAELSLAPYQIDSIYLINSNLVLEYGKFDNTPNRKIIDISELLKK